MYANRLKIPEHWIRFGSVDNGLGGPRDPFVWFKAAISEDGTTYLYYEYTTKKGKGEITYYSDQAKKFMNDCKIDLSKQAVREIQDLHLGYNTDSIEYYGKEKITICCIWFRCLQQRHVYKEANTERKKI